VGSSRIIVRSHRYPDDCTGLVRAVFDEVGVDLMREATSRDNGVTAIFRFATKHGHIFEGGRPVPGDLVFFKETYDRNRDGRNNDGLTHVGLVDDVEADGTVVIIHRVAPGRGSLPDEPRAPRRRPVYRRPSMERLAAEPSVGARPQLTGQLFAGYATLLPIEARLGAR